MDFFSLVPLVIVGLIVWAIVAAVRRSGGDAEEPGIGSVRRVFFYGLAFIALMLATLGVTLIVDRLIELVALAEISRGGSSQMAFGIAGTVVGFPVWALLWRFAERSLVQYPAERGTLGRKFYIYLVLGVAAAVVAVYLIRAAGEALALSREAFSHLGPVVVWGALWAVHWRWETAEGQPTPISKSLRRLYAYLTYTYGLVVLTVGVGLLLATLLGAAYDGLFGGRLLSGASASLWTTTTRTAIALMGVGAVWSWFHWYRVSRGDAESVLRQAVIYIVAIFGGVITAIVAAAIAVQAVLRWLIDRPDFTGAASHFDVLPAAVASVVVASSVWGYHRAVVLTEAEAAGERLVSARRAYRYLTAAVGLAALSVGLAMLFGVVIGLLVPTAQATIVEGRWWGGPLSLALTLTLIGTPVWARYWLRQQAAAREGEAGERTALSRRTFIFAVFGVAVLATLASGSTFLFMLLKAAFEGELSTQVLDGGKWAIGVALTAGTVSAYHWQVLREDRAAAPEPAPAPPTKHVTAAASQAGRALVDAIAARLGSAITTWERRDDAGAPGLTTELVDDVATRVQNAPGERVLLVVNAEGVQVIPV